MQVKDWFFEKVNHDGSSLDFFLSSLLLTVVTVTGLLFISWSAFVQLKSYKTVQIELLDNSLNSVVQEISNQIEEYTRTVTAIANDHRQLLETILAHPEDDSIHAQFNQQLKAYFPRMRAFTVVDENGNLVPDDLGERIGNYCRDEIRRFTHGDETLTHSHAGFRSYSPIIHPQPFGYHFDIMGLWRGANKQNRILFISLPATILSDVIQAHQLPGHWIYLVRTDHPDLIEVGAAGTRDLMDDSIKISDKLTDESFRSVEIPRSRWKAVGHLQPDTLPFFGQINKIKFSTDFFILLFIWIIALLILSRIHKHKVSAFKKLQTLNDNLESIVLDRTQELSKLSMAVYQSPVEILITNTNGTIEYVNPTFTKVYGYSDEEVLSKNIRQLKPFKDNKALLRDIWGRISAGEAWRGELIDHDIQGKEHWTKLSISPVRNTDNEVTHYIGIGEDITEKRAQEEKIRHQAQFDDLTGLPNRILAKDRLEQAIRLVGRTHEKVALIFVDLDDFKKVNDTLGHDIGDTLIFKAAQRLTSAIRESDTVARLGGDEFLVIVQQIKELNTVELIAHNIIDKFSRPFNLAESEFIVTASLGITLFPDDGTSAKELMRGADLAMYESKLQGKNTHHFFSPSMDAATREFSLLEQQLHNAQERDEFHVVFQPIVRLHDAFPVGCEALIRWHNPVLGVVEPERFIPVAEQTGLIIPIGEYVLREACRAMASWNANQAPKMFVAVNLSPRQFWHGGFNELVAEVLQDSGLEPQFLELELTEGMIIRDHRDTEQIMSKLNALGVRLTMDDFGTGYSSLSQLKSFPFDKLKIDRSFVQDIETDTNDDAVVRATVALAHGLALEIVAEGIESENQKQLLINENCQYGQGFLFSEPVKFDRLNQYFHQFIN